MFKSLLKIMPTALRWLSATKCIVLYLAPLHGLNTPNPIGLLASAMLGFYWADWIDWYNDEHNNEIAASATEPPVSDA